MVNISRLLWKKLLAALIIVGLVGLAACSSTPAATVTLTPSRAPTATSGPSVAITSPTGNVFQIGDVTVTVEVSNFTLVDRLGQPNVKGEGQLLYFMDVDAPTTGGSPAVTAPGTYAVTPATSYTWHNVGGGSHKFSVELVNNDRTPLNPPAVASVQVLVIPEIGPPSLAIVSPRDGAVVPTGNVTISVQVSNFNLSSELGGSNASREGHFVYFLDVNAPTAPGQPAVTASGTYAVTTDTSYTWSNVAAGSHTLSVEVVNNDNTPLDPAVTSQITITVGGVQ